MSTIHLETTIKAPIEKVFDLSRDIDFHQKSASQTSEKAIGGVTSGLINYGESVTWKGRHFGLFLQHTLKIIDFERPTKFTDVMTKGHFKYFAHQHIFTETALGVKMVDKLAYSVPYGIIGNLFDRLLLKKHLSKFLIHRNSQIKNELEKD